MKRYGTVAGIVFFLLAGAPETQVFGAGRILKTAVPLESPRKKAPRQGGPLDKVELAMWLPDRVAVVRGAVVNPFYLKAVEQKHWQAAARQWGFGIVAANYFGVKKPEFAATMKAALADFAKQSGRKEIAHLPLCFVGMSAGGGMSVQFAEQMPERTIAAAPVCLEVGPRTDASRKIPIVTIFGERDGKQMEKLLAKLPEQRRKDALWAIAVQWRRRHEFARANNLAMIWFDRTIRRRYPTSTTPENGRVALQSIIPASGWQGNVTSWGEAPATIASLKPDMKSSPSTCWFPDQYTAAVWQAFVINKPQVRILTPAGMGDGGEFQPQPADSPFDVAIKIDKGNKVSRVELFDGDRKIAESPGAVPSLRVKGLKSGIHALIAVAVTVDRKRLYSPPNTVIVESKK